MAKDLSAVGTDVVALLDRRLVNEDSDPPVRNPADCADLRDLPVMLGICNPETNVLEIARELRGQGHSEVWSPVDVFISLGRTGVQRSHYWLTSDVNLYEREALSIDLALGHLADARSRSAFTGLLRYRIGGDLRDLPDVDPPQLHYLPNDVDFISGPVSLVDGGAYVGDTVEAFVNARVDLQSVLAFEPDPDNFERLTQALANRSPGFAALALPLALGRGTGPLRFNADGTAAATLDNDGAVIVQCVSLDDALHGSSASHIKLDLEGAEPDALAGMERVLAAQRPRLAISAYHRADHLWTLLLQVAALELDYQFYLRCYGEQCFDTVVYAIPK
jgi:FkbM family methyltransferase